MRSIACDLVIHCVPKSSPDTRVTVQLHDLVLLELDVAYILIPVFKLAKLLTAEEQVIKVHEHLAVQ